MTIISRPDVITTPSVYLSVEDVAGRFSVSTDTIWRWKREGLFPKACKLGPRCTRWRLADIEAFEATLQVGFTTSFGGARLPARA